MKEYTITFAGLTVSIQYDNDEVFSFLSFLFHDAYSPVTNNVQKVFTVFRQDTSDQYSLSSTNEILFTGRLGIQFAFFLYDQVIYHLLNKKQDGVALHAGAVALQGKVIVLPGQSGSGKSSMTAWLTAQNFSYLTDELVFLPDFPSDDTCGQTIAFPRPLCIKPAAVTAIKKIMPKGNHDILEDKHGAIMPHRCFNPDFAPITPAPALILFPAYQSATPSNIEKISGAQATTSLMACNVNARNLVNHGFKQMIQIARDIPAYRINFCSFNGLTGALDDLLEQLD